MAIQQQILSKTMHLGGAEGPPPTQSSLPATADNEERFAQTPLIARSCWCTAAAGGPHQDWFPLASGHACLAM